MKEASTQELLGGLAQFILLTPGRSAMDKNCSMRKYSTIPNDMHRFYKSLLTLYSGMAYFLKQFMKRQDVSHPGPGFHGQEHSSSRFYLVYKEVVGVSCLQMLHNFVNVSY